MQVAIRVRGVVGPTIAAAFEEELAICTETVFRGQVTDDAAVHGLLLRLQNLGLGVLDVHVSSGEPLDAS